MKLIKKILLLMVVMVSCAFITSCSFSSKKDDGESSSETIPGDDSDGEQEDDKDGEQEDDKDETFLSDEEIITQLNDYTYEKVGKGYVITGVKNKTIINAIIPYGVTSIGNDAFSGCSSLTSITIPEGVTNIGHYAFSGCSSLTSITIPDSVTSIGVLAFSGCSSLQYNEFENGLYLGNETNPYLALIYVKNSLITTCTIHNQTKFILEAFNGCSSLTSVTIPDSVISIDHNAFYGCSSLQYNEYENGLYLGNETNPYLALIKVKDTEITTCTIHNQTKLLIYAFRGCSLTSITIPDSVTSIGDGAFYECSSLTSITIPESVTSIGGHVFYGCSGLTSVTIPDSVTSIGDGAFYNCRSLTSITIPKSVTSIGNDAFSGCSSLESINVEEGNKVYDSRDNCNAIIETYTRTLIAGCGKTIIPYGVTRIGDYAFWGRSSLSSITIPNSVTCIGYHAFNGCSGLTNVTIPDSVTSIENGAFSGCSSLTSITIPNSVTSIGFHSFYGCSSLQYNEYENSLYLGNETNPYLALIKAKDTEITKCTIHNQTKFILEAFNGCSSLTSVTIPDSVISIGDGAFDGCSSLTSITIPDSVTSIGIVAFYGCSGLTNVILSTGLTSIGNSAFNGCSGLTNVILSTGLTSIGNSAFEGCSSLTSITIPDSVTCIGNGAFYNCSSLTSVTIPEGVISIGRSAFNGCSSLTSITIPDTVTSIGDLAFEGCSSLQYNEFENGLYLGNETNPYLALIKAKDTEITTCTIHNQTRFILEAFNGCRSLTSITIPESVTSIEEYAFSYCSGLIKVYYEGDLYSCINLVFIIYYTPATIYYYSETQPTDTGNYWHYVDGVVTEW